MMWHKHNCVQEHDVIFSPMEDEEAGAKATQSQAAKLLSPPAVWKSKVTDIGWQFKWSLNGIQPVRAIVLVVHDITIPTGHLFVLD